MLKKCNPIQGAFLGHRMVELREKNHKSQSSMAALLNADKSTLSRVERGHASLKNITYYAGAYCDKLGLTVQQKELFMRGERIVVVDTSALLKNTQLIDELSREYSRVIVPRIVVDELDHIKDRNTKGLAAKSWQLLCSIKNNRNVTVMENPGASPDASNDVKIIETAENASEKFHCVVDLITCDVGFSARLNGRDRVRALFLGTYLMTKQGLTDMDSLNKLDHYYADSYEQLEATLKLTVPEPHELNAHLPSGNTLIISAVRNRRQPLNQRIGKIKWLIQHGADVNQRDCGKYYFPPLTHAIQTNQLELFRFLLHDCQADPNVGSRNPYDAGKIQQKNDGNMPLMVAAWDNKLSFVRELCADPRTSLNQQDGNGFTALIKACYWGWLECRDLLLAAGADEKIVDRDGFTAQQRYEEFLKTGRMKNAAPQRRTGRKGRRTV